MRAPVTRPPGVTAHPPTARACGSRCLKPGRASLSQSAGDRDTAVTRRAEKARWRRRRAAEQDSCHLLASHGHLYVDDAADFVGKAGGKAVRE